MSIIKLQEKYFKFSRISSFQSIQTSPADKPINAATSHHNFVVSSLSNELSNESEDIEQAALNLCRATCRQSLTQNPSEILRKMTINGRPATLGRVQHHNGLSD